MNPVRQLENQRHVVADQNNRKTACSHLADEFHHHPRLLYAQCRRRLVHDHYVLGKGSAASDRNTLALSAGERANRLVHGLDADFQVCHVAHRVAQHLALVQHVKQRSPEAGAPNLTPQEDVLHDVERRRDRKILIDGLDAHPPGIQRTVKMYSFAVQVDIAFIWDQRAGQRLDQRGLAGTIVADHREDLAGKQREIGAVQGDYMAEVLDDPPASRTGFGSKVLMIRPLCENWSTVTARITRMPVTST